MGRKIILDLCGGTGSWSKPYRDAGYDVRVITLPDYDVTKYAIEGEFIIFYGQGGVPDLKIEIALIYGILAAPPCTEFSKARILRSYPNGTNARDIDLEGGLILINVCLKIIQICQYKKRIKFWALENPVGKLRWFLGRPPFTFQPFEFGEGYSKPTDIWGYFNIPKKSDQLPIPLRPRGISKNWIRCYREHNYLSICDIHRSAKHRSITPQGFANAFFKANR